MVWDNSALGILHEALRKSAAGRTPATGVPFFVFLYDPTDEVRCLQHAKQLAEALRGEGTRVETVYLGQLLAHVLRTKKRLYLSDAGKQVEARDRAGLAAELSRPEGLPASIVEALLDGVGGTTPALRGGQQDDVVLLLRAGALFPFVHVSQLLNGLENHTRWTVAVPFPGSRDPQQPDTLRFLNETEGPYYRAQVIG